MANIFINISKFISPEYTLVRHSALTQNLIGSATTILWNDNISNIEESTYDRFKDALKKRGSKFYTHNDILPYSDFCIALLSTNNYSLNHVSTPLIPARTYTAAWRSLHIISSIAEPSVREWISSSILGRTALGYSSTHGLEIDNTISLSTSYQDTYKSTELSRDEDMLNEALQSEKIIPIPHSSNNNYDISILYSTATPECQLANLKIYHDIMSKYHQ